MAKDRSDSECTHASAYTVFINTNFNTHFALNVSDEDRLSDLKNKIMIEHLYCFPDIGEIRIHALKVKRKGFFYHLSDSMLVKSVFETVKRTWFLYVDASSSHVENQSDLDPDVSKPGAFICITNDHSAERNILIPPLKNLAVLNDMPLLPIASSQAVEQKVSPDDQFGPGDVSKGSSNELNKEADHSSFGANKRLDSLVNEKHDPVGDANKVPGTHTEQLKDDCHNRTGEIRSDSTLELPVPPKLVAKKKHKNEKKNEDAFYDVFEDPLKENDPGIHSSGKETSKQGAITLENSDEDVQKVNIATSLDDSHLFRTNSNTRKRKRIKNKKSLDSEVLSFGKSVEEMSSNVPGNNDSGLGKESDVVNAPKRGIDMYDPDSDEVEKQSDASQLTVASGGSKMKRPKKHQAAKIKGLTPLAVEEPDTLFMLGNRVDSPIPSSMKDLREESSRVVGNDDKDLGEESDAVLATQNAVRSVTLSKSSVTYEKEKCISVQEGGNAIPFSSLGGSSVPEPKIDFIDNVLNSSVDIVTCESDSCKVESKRNASEQSVAAGRRKVKKVKKHRASNAEELAPPVVEERDDQKKDSSPSGNENIILDANKCGTGVPVKVIGEEQVCSQKADASKVASEMRNKHVDVLPKSLDAAVSEAEDPGNKRKKKLKKAKISDAKQGSFQADAKADYLVNGCTDEVSYHLEGSKCDKIDFIDYFMPSQGEHEVITSAKELVGKEIKMKRSDTEKKKLDLHSRDASPDLQNLLKSNGNLGRKRKVQGGTLDTVQLKSKDEHGDPMPHTNKESLIVARGSGVAPTSHSSAPVKASRTKIVNASRISSPVHTPVARSPSRASTKSSFKENIEALDASSSSSESSEERIDQNEGSRGLKSRSNPYHVAVGNASSKKTGKVLNSSNQEKSLLAMSSTIYKDSSSESSKDEGQVSKSEASTRTPSDSSSSSDFSEDDNNTNPKSPRNGIDMHDPDADEVEKQSDAAQLTVSSGGRKMKRPKKHQAAKIKGITPPAVEEPDNLFMLGNRVDSAVPSSMKDLREESSRVVGNDDKDLGEESDAVLATQNAVRSVTLSKSSATYEKEKCISVQGGNAIPFSSLGGSSVPEPKIDFIDNVVNSSVDIVLCEPDSSKVEESKRDASDQTVAAGKRKVKRLKKHRASNAEELAPPAVEERDDQKKDTLPSGNKNIVLGANKCGTGLPGKVKREEQGCSQKADANKVASEMRNKHVDVLPKLLDATVSEAEDPGNKRKKKLKKVKTSDAKQGSLQADAKADYLANGCADEVSNRLEGSKCDSGRIDLIDSFMPCQGEHGVVASAKELVGKEIKMKRSDTEKKTLDLHSRDTSPDLQNLLKSNGNLGRKRKAQGGTSDTVQLKSKDEHGDPMPHTNKESLIVARGSGVAPTSHSSAPVKASRTKIVNASRISSLVHTHVARSPSRASTKSSFEENIEALDASSSSSESSEERIDQNEGSRGLQSRSNPYHVAVRNASSKKTGKVLNSSNQEKSLLAMSGIIYKDSSSESSEDEGEVSKSEACIRTPSDSSSSSDFSEDDNNTNPKSPRNGIDMCDPDADKVEKQSDASQLTVSCAGNKMKRPKKHQAAKIKGLTPPAVEEPDILFMLGNRVDSAVPLSMKSIREESSRVVGNDDKDLGEESDAAVLASPKAVRSVTLSKSSATYEKEKCISVRGNTIPFLPLGGSYVPEPKIDLIDNVVNSSVDIVSCEPDSSKVEESKRNASDQTVAAGKRKVKRLKKHRASNAEELAPPAVEERDDQKKDTLPSGNKNIVLGANKCGTGLPGKVKGEEQGCSQKADANKVASEMRNKHVGVLPKLLDAAVSEAEDPENKRKKKLKKPKTSDAKQGSLQADAKADYLVNGCADEVSNRLEGSKCDSGRIDLIDSFMPSQGEHEVVASAKELVGKEIKMKKSNTEKKKIDLHSRGASHDLQNLLKSNENLGCKRKARGSTSDTVHLKSKDEHGDPMPHTNKESLIVARGSGVAPTSHSSDVIKATPVKASRTEIVNASSRISSPSGMIEVTPVKASRTMIVNASRISSPVHTPVARSSSRASTKSSFEENIEALDPSSSSSESSEERIDQNEGSRGLQSRSNPYHVVVRNASSKKTGKVLNRSNQEKSLLATSNTIFKDSSSESSEDEGEVNKSDASTRTPSDSSSSSDFSEDDNSTNPKSSRNGNYDGKRKENGGKNITRSKSLGAKDIALDMILRSSRSYKKAKLTASQSQVEDTESQHIDFVQDSQANL